MKIPVEIWVFAAIVVLAVGLGVSLNKMSERALANPEVVVVEGCEYLKIRGYGGTYSLSHKGNCKNH